MTEEVNVPYIPPLYMPRGWTIGPSVLDFDLAASVDGACLDANVTVDQLNSMDLAIGGGACLDGSIVVTDIVNIGMDLAVGSGIGLDANVSVDQRTDMLLADGSGGTALVPTLSIVNPITFGALGAGAGNFVNPGTTLTISWNHTKAAADNCVVVPIAWNGNSPAGIGNSSCTYGGVPMTRLYFGAVGPIYSSASTYEMVEWWYLMSPAGGAQTVSYTGSWASGYVSIEGASLSYSSVASVVAPGTKDASGSGTSVSHTTASAANRVLVQAISSYQSVSGGNKTPRSSGVNWGLGLVQEAPGAASVTFTAGTSGSPWASGLLELR